MYRSKDLREAAIRYRMEGHTLIETAKVFGVGKTSVSRWEKQYVETDDLIITTPKIRGMESPIRA